MKEMKEMKEMDRNIWNGLSNEEKEAAMRSIPSKLPQGFVFQGLKTFNRYGVTHVTGIFTYKDREYIFIPGDQVTLGWESWEKGMDETTRDDLLDSVSEYDIEDLDQFLRDQMSPVRQAVIGAMLVERAPRSVGWKEIPLQDISSLGDPEVESELEKFRASTYSQYEHYQHFRFVRKEDEIALYMFNQDLSYEQVMTNLNNEGFSLLTEDEWEYIYGGGCRTLFPWGDSFIYSMKLKYFEELDADQTSKDYDLELPNAFGLIFVGDPYQCEWTTHEGFFIPKGGDGGNLICGGSGSILGYLPTAAVYYRDPYSDDSEWEEMTGHLHYRNIVRL